MNAVVRNGWAALAFAIFAVKSASGHGGGLDAAGCHHDRKNGGYHCHRAGYQRAPTTAPPSISPAPPTSTNVEGAGTKNTLPPSTKGPETVVEAPAELMNRQLPSMLSDWRARDQVQRVDRASYWKERGFDFDPRFMSAHAMDTKVKDVERAKYWESKGHHFNPLYMSAHAMDQKVKDIERARYWSERGYSFNPEYMSAFAMDQKVKDIERAKYWAERGFNFNPDYMSAYAMDREAQKASAGRAVQR